MDTPAGIPTASPTWVPPSTPNGGDVLATTLYSFGPGDSNYVPDYLTVGPDGEVCFTWLVATGVSSAQYGGVDDYGLGCVTATGSVDIWDAPASWTNASMGPLTSGGGYLWALEAHGSSPSFPYVGQWTTDGQLVAEYPLPGGFAYGITWSDGDLWISGETAGSTPAYIGEMTPAGALTTYTLPDPTEPVVSLVAADGDVWFIQSREQYVGMVSPSGRITDFPIPGAVDNGGNLPNQNLAVAADGSVWVAMSDEPAVGFVSVAPGGTMTEYPLSSAGSACAGGTTDSGAGVAIGADGDVWTPMRATSALCRLAPSGTITGFSVSGTDWLGPADIISGPGGLLWLGLDGSLASFDPSTTPAVVTTPAG
jgi:virginiamycin B lyase